MDDGGNIGAKGGGKTSKEDSSIAIYIFQGTSRARHNWSSDTLTSQQHSSQERPTKIPAIIL